jgi:hypothetical protein
MKFQNRWMIRKAVSLVCVASLAATTIYAQAAPSAAANAVTADQLKQGLEIPEGTKVRVRLDQPLSSESAQLNQALQLSASEDVKINDVVMIPRGAVVNGTVVQAVPKRTMGRTGKLDFSIDNIIAPDGGKIGLRYSVVKRNGGSHAVRTGVITAGVAVLFWPAAPFMLLMHGKEATFPQGMTFEVFTDANYTIKPNAATSTTSFISAISAPPAGVTITSEPSGADIIVDGAFVGNTPSTVQMRAGTHAVQVTKASLRWERDLTVQSGSNLNVAATLKEKTQESVANRTKP